MMSAALREPVALSLTDGIVRVWDALFARCRSGGPVAVVHAGRGSATKAYHVSVSPRLGHVPEWLLNELAFADVDEIRIAPGTRDNDGGQCLRDLGAAFVRLPTPPEFDGAQWKAPQSVVDAAWTRLELFPIPPPIVIDDSAHLVALWPLCTALPLDHAPDHARASALQEALAGALGGAVDDVTIAMPTACPARTQRVAAHAVNWTSVAVAGSRGAHGVAVRLVRFREDRVTVEDLEAAVHTANIVTRPVDTKEEE